MKFFADLQQVLQSPFGKRIFLRLTGYVLAIGLLFFCAAMIMEYRNLDHELLSDGQQLVDIYAHAVHLGIFTEDRDLLRNPTDALLSQRFGAGCLRHRQRRPSSHAGCQKDTLTPNRVVFSHPQPASPSARKPCRPAFPRSSGPTRRSNSGPRSILPEGTFQEKNCFSANRRPNTPNS